MTNSRPGRCHHETAIQAIHSGGPTGVCVWGGGGGGAGGAHYQYLVRISFSIKSYGGSWNSFLHFKLPPHYHAPGK